MTNRKPVGRISEAPSATPGQTRPPPISNNRIDAAKKRWNRRCTQMNADASGPPINFPSAQRPNPFPHPTPICVHLRLNLFPYLPGNLIVGRKSEARSAPPAQPRHVKYQAPPAPVAAASEKLAARQTETFFADHRACADREAFLRILNRAGGAEPRADDTLEEVSA